MIREKSIDSYERCRPELIYNVHTPPELFAVLVSILAPLVESLVKFLHERVISNDLFLHIYCAPAPNLLTFGKFTLGTITLCRALGASLGAFFGLPYGWYLYLYSSPASPPLPSVCHGMLPGATVTFASDVADVGFFPVRGPVLAKSRPKRELPRGVS